MQKQVEKKYVTPIFLRKPERSNSVKLLLGYLTENPGSVLVKKCERCFSGPPKLVAVNYADPQVQLWGCQVVKCRKFLIKIDLG